jgi:acyl dehydratase
MFFEDFEMGQEYRTKGRTITETDLILFSGISGVYSPLHLDEHYCKSTIFKRRIAHGPLILAISNGLVGMLNLYEDSLIALLEIVCKFKNPVYIGDTVKATEVVHSKRKTKTAGRGIVEFERHIYNQNDEEVQNMKLVVLLKTRETP